MRNQVNIPDSLGLTNPEYIARYNSLSSKLVVATQYYDEDVLNRLGFLDDIRWLFARGRISQFLETRDHTYWDFTLEFLSTLHVEVKSDPQCQEGYISFYLNGEFCELNLNVFNSIFDFSPSM